MSDTTPTMRELRHRLGLSQMALAVKAEIGLVTVSRCESSNLWPKNARTRQRFARALGLSADPVTGFPMESRT